MRILIVALLLAVRAASADAALVTYSFTGETEYTVCPECDPGDPLLLPPQFGDPNTPASSLGQPFSATVTIDTDSPSDYIDFGLYSHAITALSVDLNGLQLVYDEDNLGAYSFAGFSGLSPGPYYLDFAAVYGRGLFPDPPLSEYRVTLTLQVYGPFPDSDLDLELGGARTGRFGLRLQRSDTDGSFSEARISGLFAMVPEPAAPLLLAAAGLASAALRRRSARR